MVCHKSCRKEKACHEQCSCPFEQKQAACDNLAEVIACHKKGGNHHTCKLDQDAKELLLHEPWSLVRDVANHVVDHVLPAEPLASCQEVHMPRMRLYSLLAAWAYLPLQFKVSVEAAPLPLYARRVGGQIQCSA